MLLTTSCIDPLFSFAVAVAVLQFDCDILLGVGDGVGFFRISLQSMQEAHSEVEVGFLAGGLMPFRTRMFRIVLGR